MYLTQRPLSNPIQPLILSVDTGQFCAAFAGWIANTPERDLLGAAPAPPALLAAACPRAQLPLPLSTSLSRGAPSPSSSSSPRLQSGMQHMQLGDGSMHSNESDPRGGQSEGRGEQKEGSWPPRPPTAPSPVPVPAPFVVTGTAGAASGAAGGSGGDDCQRVLMLALAAAATQLRALHCLYARTAGLDAGALALVARAPANRLSTHARLLTATDPILALARRPSGGPGAAAAVADIADAVHERLQRALLASLPTSS